MTSYSKSIVIAWIFAGLLVNTGFTEPAERKFRELLTNSPFVKTEASPSRDRPKIEFCGYYFEGPKVLLSISISGVNMQRRQAWVELHETFEGYIVRSFDQPTDRVVLQSGTELLRLSLKQAKVQLTEVAEVADSQESQFERFENLMAETLRSESEEVAAAESNVGA